MPVGGEELGTGVRFFFDSSNAVNNASKMSTSLGGLDSMIKKVGVAAGAYLSFRGVKAAVGGIVGAGQRAENQLTRLETSVGSAKEAFDLYTKSVKVADITPFETEDVVTSVVKLSAYSIKAFEQIGDTGVDNFTAVGDMAGSMGKSIDQATEAIADALTGEMERMKEFGITVNTLPPRLKNLERGSAKWREEFMKYIAEMPRFKGGMEKMAKTMTGLLSTIRGYFSSFLRIIAGVGDEMTMGATKVATFYDDVKSGIASFLNFLVKYRDTLWNIARVIGQVFRIAWVIVKNVFGLIGKIVMSLIKRFEDWWGVFGKGDAALRVFATKIAATTIWIDIFFQKVAQTVKENSSLIVNSFIALGSVIAITLIPTLLRLGQTLTKTLAKGGFILVLGATIDLIRNWDDLDSKAKKLRYKLIALGAGFILLNKLFKFSGPLLSKVLLPKLGQMLFLFTKLAITGLPKLLPLMSIMIAKVWAFSAALLANPITWIVLGVAALTAGIIALVAYWPEVKAFGVKMLGWFMDAAKRFGSWVGDLWNSIVDGTKSMVIDFLNWFIEKYNTLAGYIGAGKAELLKTEKAATAAGATVTEGGSAIPAETARELSRPAATKTITHHSSATISINESGNPRETAAYVVNFMDRVFAGGGTY